MNNHDFKLYGHTVQCSLCGVNPNSLQSIKPCAWPGPLKSDAKELSRRDEFALAAMQGLLSGFDEMLVDDLVDMSVLIADKMVARLDDGR